MLAYVTSLILLGGFLSIRRRAEVNDFLRRMDEYTTATRDPQVPYKSKSGSVSFLYTVLTALVLHSVCLSYTTAVLDYKVIPKASTVKPLPSDNATSGKGAPGPQSTPKLGQGGNSFGGALDHSMGGMFDAGEDAGEAEDPAGGFGAPMNDPGHEDEGGEAADDGEVDDETHGGRRRRRSAARVGYGAPSVREIVVVASDVLENDVNDPIDNDNETADESQDQISEEKVCENRAIG